MSNLEESAFQLSADEMEQIQYLEALKRRKKKQKEASMKESTKNGCFSDGLSVEAQIAMQMALEDGIRHSQENGACKATKTDCRVADSGYGQSETSFSAKDSSTDSFHSVETGQALKEEAAVSKNNSSTRKSFAELYKRNNSARMRKDITDECYSEANESKRALGGGKLESAMEIVEIVHHEGEGNQGIDIACSEFDIDDEVITELARINSVEKCEVWIQATDDQTSDSEKERPG